jgi:hypothetical protein
MGRSADNPRPRGAIETRRNVTDFAPGVQADARGAAAHVQTRNTYSFPLSRSMSGGKDLRLSA